MCAESERALLAKEGAPEHLLWCLFAAKEAAFKVVCKLGPTPVFAHRKFVVADDLLSVSYGPFTLALRIDANPAWVHAVAATFSPAPAGRVARREPGRDESEAARALLFWTLNQRFDFAVSLLEVVRAPDPSRWDGLGAPRVLLQGEPVQVDVSLSHDGAFVACAMES